MKLKELRFRAGYTQREFAKLLNCGASYLSCIEHGRYPLSPKMRRKAAQILNIDPMSIET